MEGNVDEIEEITENPLIFYGAISTVVLDFKIPVIPTPSATHTAKLLVSMCSRKDAPKGPYLKKIKKSSDLEKQQLSVLCSLQKLKVWVNLVLRKSKKLWILKANFSRNPIKRRYMILNSSPRKIQASKDSKFVLF
jgi:ERCC4-type nuclease